MTYNEARNTIITNLTRVGTNRISSAELLEAVLIVLDFAAAIDNADAIPPWTAALTFQTDGTDDGKYCTHPDSNGKKRIWETKIDANINNEPPIDPNTTEDANWEEISASAASGIQEWAPGLYGAGLVIVYHNHSTQGRGLYALLEPVRPFNSTNIETEITAGKWEEIAGGVDPEDELTAADITATNQSGTGLRFAILDAAGKVVRNGNAEWDDTNKTFILRGLNDLSSTYAFELYNLSGDLLMKVSNGQFVEFGGTSAFLTVPSTIIAGNAGMIFRDIEGIQLRFKDDSSNDYMTFEKLSSGERIVRTRRTRVMDTGVGMAEFEGQVLLRLPNTTAGTHHNILTIAIPANAALSLDVTRAIAYATNNSYIRATQFTADAKNVAGTVTSDVDAIDHKPLPGTLTGTFNVTISGTNMIVRFQNNDALTIDVWLSYKYTVLTLPTV